MNFKKNVNYFLKNLFIILLVFSFVFSVVNFKTYAKNTKAQEKISSISNETEGLENDDTLYMTNEYATHYFYNLTENFGVNIMGSCGYVALGMLLGYYDTYWNDNFIPEEFDQNAVLLTNSFTTNVSSPGGEREPNVLGQKYSDVQDYIQRVVNYSVNNNCNYNNYLHLNLIKMGLDEKYYGENGPSISDDLGLSEDAYIYDLTQKYLYRERSFTANDVKIEWDCVESMDTAMSEDLRIRLFVEDRVKQGIPVLISAAKIGHNNSVLERHAMVAYDYKFENNKNILYVHTGQIQENSSIVTHISLDDLGYNVLTSAIALQPKTNHSDTNNYKYNNTTYCPCSNQTFYQGKVVFENLYCLGTNATLLNNNVPTNYSTPITFSYFTPVDISHMSAQVTSYGYDPYYVFLGWYRDMDFTTKITTTPTNITGDCILYAKWRIDYGWLASHGERTVTSAGVMSNASDQIYVGSVEELRQLQSMGITKLTISFHINMWEVKDLNKAIQYIYLYGGAGGNTQLASTTFNVTSSKEVQCVRFTVNISDLEENPYVYIRYNASETKFLFIKESHDWKNDERFVEISYVVNESDITGDNAADFVWRYENPLALKCSNCN